MKVTYDGGAYADHLLNYHNDNYAVKTLLDWAARKRKELENE